MEQTRRRFLEVSAGAVATVTVAGCLDGRALGASNGVESGYAAFFTLWDWSRQVSGAVATFHDPVPAGEMGHGWEPEGDLLRDVAEADAFVYLDLAEFRWAQDVADTLARDYDHVAVIDALAGVDVLTRDGEHVHDHDRTENHGHADHEHDESADHDPDGGHGPDDVDPHVWTDPVRAGQMVENVANGLADADPASAATFEENAAAYERRLAEVDEQFRAVFDAADVDVVVVAGHNSYQYLEDRYGIEIHAPQGVSPHDSPGPNDVAATIDLVDDHGIDTILYDYFGPSRLANTIVENSSATSVEAVTPAEGTTPEWRERGWGYVEQLEEVTIPAFEKAVSPT